MKAERLTYQQSLGIAIVLMAVATFTACQGVSSAGKSTQPQTDAGELSLDSSSLSFGTVTVGQSSSLHVTAVNNGTATVTVSAATPSTSQFALTAPGLPLSVAAGQSASLTVSFTPSAPGNVSGTMSISSDASTGPVSISLSGSGVSPGSLVSEPASVGFGSVLVGNSQQQSVSIVNSGGTSVTISQITASAGFTWSGVTLPLTVPATQSATVTVTFTPQSVGNASGSLTLTSNATNAMLTVPLSGTGSNSPGALSANPTSLSFGSVQLGNSQTLSESLTNTGGSDVTISQATPSTEFSLTGFTPPITLSPGQSYSFSVVFAPQTVGSAGGTLTITSDGSNPSLAIALSGTGLANGSLSVTPSTLSFGNVVVGTNSALTGKLTASSASVTITKGSSNNGEFVLSGISFPLTLQAGGSASYTVTFTPQSTGSASGTLTFTSNASNGPTTTESLTGNGTPPPVHSVVVSWTASSSPNISSYDIYRGTTSGGPYTQVGSVTAPTTTFTDNSVTDGVTYYYVATAVNSGGQQSGDSNQATAQIPPP